jgi:hypothetical protein
LSGQEKVLVRKSFDSPPNIEVAKNNSRGGFVVK